MEAGTDGGKKKPIQGTRNRPVTGDASQLGKGLGTKLVRALVELLFNDPEVTRSKRTRRRATCERSDATTKAGFEQGTVTTPDGPAVYMVQTRQAFERTRSVANPSSRGRPRAGALGRPSCQTVNIMREAVIAEVSTQLSVVGVIERHLEPTLLCTATFGGSAVDGGLKPHSDIDLLVTVTVRLDETTRRALINDLLETSASPGEERDSPRCRSHHCCARRHHSVALSS